MPAGVVRAPSPGHRAATFGGPPLATEVTVFPTFRSRSATDSEDPSVAPHSVSIVVRYSSLSISLQLATIETRQK